MTESPHPIKHTKWSKGPLINGLFLLIFVFIIVFGVAIAIPGLESLNGKFDFLTYPLIIIWGILFLGLTAPATLIGQGFNNGSSLLLPTLFTIVFWFSLGALLNYIGKNTKRKIVWGTLIICLLALINILFGIH